MDYKLTIKRKNVKNISIRVLSDEEILLTLPLFVSKRSGLEFLKSKERWIEKKLLQMPKALKVEEGNELKYLGKNYIIKLGGNIIAMDKRCIYIPKDNSTKLLDKFLRKKAKEIFTKLVYSWAERVDKKINRVSIKKMRTRWGSCNTKKSYINLNLNLIHYHIDTIEYVVLHEIAHLTYPNHSKEFYSYIESFMPDWKERERLLSSNF